MDTFDAVSLSDSLARLNKKFFSVSEANRSLPLVRRIVADIIRDYEQLCLLHSACKANDVVGDLSRAEKTREKYVRVTDHLSELQEELEKIGCEIRDYRIGLVEFPALLDGREVYLCWQSGQDHVTHWRGRDPDHAGRRPITREFA